MLRYGLERDGLPVYAPEGLEKVLAGAGRRLGRHLRLAHRRRRRHAIDRRRSTSVLAHRSSAAHRRGRDRRTTASASIYTADTGPDWSVDAFGPGADLVLSEATYLHDDIRAPIHLSAQAGRRSARARRRRARLMLTHLWPTLDPASLRRGGLGGVRAGGVARGSAPHHAHLIPSSRPPGDRVGIRRDGREPDDLRAWSPSPATSPRWPPVRCSSSSGSHARAVHRVGRGARPAVAEGHGQGLGHRRVLDAARARPPSAIDREAAAGKQIGRTQEIQRLIGRSLRAVTDLAAMPDVQITVDCDVLQADGGTRTASICGGWIALHDACCRLVADGKLGAPPGHRPVRRDLGRRSSTRLPMLDLEYTEDVRAEVDMNVVMTGDGSLRRGAGHRRGRGVHPRRARRPARPGRGGIAEIVDAPARDGGRAAPAAVSRR